MLTTVDNDALTRVGPGTPMGELFRRFWLPALTSSELAEPGGAPVRLRILDEDLLAFRDTAGNVGIVDAYCAHRGAPLFYGRNEGEGLRCVYHGWMFDVRGACVEVPNSEPLRNPAARSRLGIKAYPTCETGGAVWIYMGPEHLKPQVPALEWANLPPERRRVGRYLQRSNWLQGAEGEIDSSHVSFVHKTFDSSQRLSRLFSDGSPFLHVRETDYGFTSVSRRQVPDGYYWRATQWLLPMYSLVPRNDVESFSWGAGRCWVPIDDYNTATFAFSYTPERPMREQEIDLFESGNHFPPKKERQAVRLDDGYIIDIDVPLAGMHNDYGIDRTRQRTESFSGIEGLSAQDRAVQETMRPIKGGRQGIADRSREHLMASDIAIATARRRLLKAVGDLQNGIEPRQASEAALYSVRAIGKVCDVADVDEFFQKFGSEAVPPVHRG